MPLRIQAEQLLLEVVGLDARPRREFLDALLEDRLVLATIADPAPEQRRGIHAAIEAVIRFEDLAQNTFQVAIGFLADLLRTLVLSEQIQEAELQDEIVGDGRMIAARAGD